MSKGVIYILTNPSFSEYVKIGYAKDLEKRMGILVASNNNAAVKNITHDLPKSDSIASEYNGRYDYFSEVSNRLLKQETWGICSAALGNAGRNG